MVIGHLEVTTWQGISIGAVHWYCKVIVEENDKDVEHTDIERPLAAKEAATLNKEELERGLFSCRNKAGDMTNGFITEEEAIQAGIEYFKSKYDGVLFNGDYVSCSAWKKVILWPKNLTPLVKEMNEIADKFQSLNGYEGKQRKQVEQLDKRWYKRYVKLQELCQNVKNQNDS